MIRSRKVSFSFVFVCDFENTVALSKCTVHFIINETAYIIINEIKILLIPIIHINLIQNTMSILFCLFIIQKNSSG